MTLRRNLALPMLIAILIGIAAPAFACLSEGVMPAGHDCCAAMESCGATMTSSCCDLAPRNNTPELVAEYSPEHHPYAVLPPVYIQPSQAHYGTTQFALQLASPPDPSPGGLSVLRI